MLIPMYMLSGEGGGGCVCDWEECNKIGCIIVGNYLFVKLNEFDLCFVQFDVSSGNSKIIELVIN